MEGIEIRAFLASPSGGEISTSSTPVGQVTTSSDGNFSLVVLSSQTVESYSPASVNWIFGINTQNGWKYLGANDKVLNVESGIVFYNSNDPYNWEVGHSLNNSDITIDMGQVSVSNN